VIRDHEVDVENSPQLHCRRQDRFTDVPKNRAGTDVLGAVAIALDPLALPRRGRSVFRVELHRAGAAAVAVDT